MPSPRFWTRCLSSVKGAWPIHCAPSPPICVMPVISPFPSGLSSTIVWQPMPPPTSVPSGAGSDELCGQPEQKNGCALGHRQLGRAARDPVEALQVRVDRVDPHAASAQAAGDRAGDHVGVHVELRRQQRARPCSSRLPTMRGASAVP